MGHKAMAWKIKAALASAAGLRAMGSLMVLSPMALWFLLPVLGPALIEVLGGDSKSWPPVHQGSGIGLGGGWRQAAILLAMLVFESVGFWLVAMGFKARESMAGWEQKAFSHEEAGVLESSVCRAESSKNGPKRL